MKKLLFVFSLPFFTASFYGGSNPLDLLDNHGLDKEIFRNKKQLQFSVDGQIYQMYSSTSELKGRIGNLELFETYRSQQYQQDGFGYYYTYSIERMYSKAGVYTNYLNTYYSDAQLKSGSYTFSNTSENNFAASATMSARSNINFHQSFVVDLGARASFAGLTGSLSSGTSFGFNHSQEISYLYSRSISYHQKETRTLGAASAKYCPTGHYMSMGLIGEWTEISGSYTYWKDIWDILGGDRVLATGEFTITIANFDNLLEGFIYARPREPSFRGYLGPVSQNPEFPLPNC